MKTILAFCLLLFPLTIFSKVIDLNEAIQQNLVSIKVVGEGGHSGKSLKISFLNMGKKDLEIRVPAGQIFHSEDSTLQDLIIIKEKQLAIEGKQKRLGKFFGLCTQAGNGSPRPGSLFNLGVMATGTLLKVAQYISEKNLQEDRGAQSAIWAITDGHRLENIANMELANYVAEILGKTPPEYAVIHQNRSLPGQPAFQENPVSMEGIFKYELPKDQLVSFGLYDENDELIHTFRENTRQIKGYHKFKFFFEIRNLPKGKYSVKLTGKEGIIREMDVEF